MCSHAQEELEGTTRPDPQGVGKPVHRLLQLSPCSAPCWDSQPPEPWFSLVVGAKYSLSESSGLIVWLGHMGQGRLLLASVSLLNLVENLAAGTCGGVSLARSCWSPGCCLSGKQHVSGSCYCCHRCGKGLCHRAWVLGQPGFCPTGQDWEVRLPRTFHLHNGLRVR